MEACEYLSQHIHTEGIFRKTGSLCRIRALRVKLIQLYVNSASQEGGVSWAFVLTCVRERYDLKQFLLLCSQLRTSRCSLVCFTKQTLALNRLIAAQRLNIALLFRR